MAAHDGGPGNQGRNSATGPFSTAPGQEATSRLPLLAPIARAEDGRSIAVVYLARSGDGSVKDFEPFVSSYRKHDAGIAHDLIVIRKGLGDRLGSQQVLSQMLDGTAHRTFDIADDGLDIQAFLRVAPCLGHDRVCFFNTFSEINADGWLRKLNAPLDEPGIGITGATASYESLVNSHYLLARVAWLAGIKNIQYRPDIARQYHDYLALTAPGWLAKRGGIRRRVLRELARPFLGRPYDTPEMEREFQAYWRRVTRADGPLAIVRQVRPFPNPHLRSNAFMLDRALLLDLGFVLDDTKTACNLFECGREGIMVRLARRGLAPRLVGADGTAFAVEDWPRSRTFRLGDQSNVLVLDNQVRNFAAMSRWQKALHTRITWGDYLPRTEPGLLEFDATFERGPLGILDAPATCPAPASSPVVATRRRLYSVVIPTHERLALLRDAVGSILKQGGPDWECVVFDNASEEPVRDFVAGLNDPRVRYERSDAFLPVTESWNRAIDLARGDYVTLIGDDDGLAPDFFRRVDSLVEQFAEPDAIYSALYQFFHPGVAPWERSGYVCEVQNASFIQDRNEPFLLTREEARHALLGSLGLRRNFTFNMQAFTFSKGFLAKARRDDRVFHSPFPDYYLANVLMGAAERIVVSPQPLAVAGVSRASFGFTLFNNDEERGAQLLKSALSEDPFFQELSGAILPGPRYNTNYLVTMRHVALHLGGGAELAPDVNRYRRLQILSRITAEPGLRWMRKPPGSELWGRLSWQERAWALRASLLAREAGRHRLFAAAFDALKRRTEPYAFIPPFLHREVGRFATLPQFLDALETGRYPPHD